MHIFKVHIFQFVTAMVATSQAAAVYLCVDDLVFLKAFLRTKCTIAAQPSYFSTCADDRKQYSHPQQAVTHRRLSFAVHARPCLASRSNAAGTHDRL